MGRPFFFARFRPGVCSTTQRRSHPPASVVAIGQTEGAMRAYVETIALILGLLGAYFALLPLAT